MAFLTQNLGWKCSWAEQTDTLSDNEDYSDYSNDSNDLSTTDQMRFSDDEESAADTSGGVALPKPSAGGGTIYGGSSKSTMTGSVALSDTSYPTGKIPMSSNTAYSSMSQSTTKQTNEFNRSGYSGAFKSSSPPSSTSGKSERSGWAKPIDAVKTKFEPDAVRNQDKAYKQLEKSKQRLAPEDDIGVESSDEDEDEDEDSPAHGSSTRASGVNSQGHGKSKWSQSSSADYDSDGLP